MINKLKSLILAPFRKFKKFSLKKKILTVVILIAVVIVAGQILGKNGRKEEFKTAKVTLGTIEEVVIETGNISTNSRTDVYSPANGIIESVLVTNGNAVTVGQELFTIVSTATEQEKSQALANYLTAKNTLDTANSTLYSLQSTMFSKWDTFKQLAESDYYENSDGRPRYEQRALAEFHIAEKDWLAAESNYKKQQAVINQAQAAVSSSYLLYQATQNATVKANSTGTVNNLSVTVGSSVKVNSAAQPQTPLATIANLSSTEVIASLSEDDVVKVKPDQEANIEVQSIDDKTYSGIVRRVDTIGNNTAGVIRYNAYIEVTNPDELLRPGMNVDITIITSRLDNVLTVPNSSIKPYQGTRAVRIRDEKGEIKYIPVKVGLKGEEKTQIISGLTEGQEIITTLTNEQIKRSGLFVN